MNQATITLESNVNREAVEAALAGEEWVQVVFTKKNGDERTMQCVARPDIVGIEVEYTEGERKPNDATRTVWDTEVNAWRTFRWDSLKDFQVITKETEVNTVGNALS